MIKSKTKKVILDIGNRNIPGLDEKSLWLCVPNVRTNNEEYLTRVIISCVCMGIKKSIDISVIQNPNTYSIVHIGDNLYINLNDVSKNTIGEVISNDTVFNTVKVGFRKHKTKSNWSYRYTYDIYAGPEMELVYDTGELLEYVVKRSEDLTTEIKQVNKEPVRTPTVKADMIYGTITLNDVIDTYGWTIGTDSLGRWSCGCHEVLSNMELYISFGGREFVEVNFNMELHQNAIAVIRFDTDIIEGLIPRDLTTESKIAVKLIYSLNGFRHISTTNAAKLCKIKYGYKSNKKGSL